FFHLVQRQRIGRCGGGKGGELRIRCGGGIDFDRRGRPRRRRGWFGGDGRRRAHRHGRCLRRRGAGGVKRDRRLGGKRRQRGGGREGRRGGENRGRQLRQVELGRGNGAAFLA